MPPWPSSPAASSSAPASGRPSRQTPHCCCATSRSSRSTSGTSAASPSSSTGSAGSGSRRALRDARREPDPRRRRPGPLHRRAVGSASGRPTRSCAPTCSRTCTARPSTSSAPWGASSSSAASEAPRAPPPRRRPERRRTGRRADLMDVLSTVFSFQDYGELLVLVQNSILAGAVLGIVGGLIGPFVVARNMPFAVHGISELSFAGASASLLLGVNVVDGLARRVGGRGAAHRPARLAGSRPQLDHRRADAVRARPRHPLPGALQGRAANKFGLLTGQIVSVDNPQLTFLIVGRRDRRRHADRHLAPADVRVRRPRRRRGRRGCPVRTLALVFMLMLGLATAVSVQIVGALLVLSLLVTPAAAALRLTVAPGPRARAVDGVRGGVGRRWHPAGTRRRPADQSVRDDDLVRHLGRLPHRRRATRQPGTRPGRRPGPARRGRSRASRPDDDHSRSGQEEVQQNAVPKPSGTRGSAKRCAERSTRTRGS